MTAPVSEQCGARHPYSLTGLRCERVDAHKWHRGEGITWIFPPVDSAPALPSAPPASGGASDA